MFRFQFNFITIEIPEQIRNVRRLKLVNILALIGSHLNSVKNAVGSTSGTFISCLFSANPP